MTNLFWGSIYGATGVWFHETGIGHPLWTDAIWLFGWPAVAIAATGWLAGKLWEFWPKRRATIASLYLMSLLPLTPVEPIMVAEVGHDFAFESLPLWVKLAAY
jgi:hypothetical protein